MEDELAISLISDLTQELSNDDVQSKDVIGNVLTSLGLKTNPSAIQFENAQASVDAITAGSSTSFSARQLKNIS